MDGLHTRNGNGNRTHPPLVAQTRPRSPGVAYTIVTIALAVLVATLALTSRQFGVADPAEFERGSRQFRSQDKRRQCSSKSSASSQSDRRRDRSIAPSGT